MTLTQTFASKTLVAFVATAMVFSMFASAANAQTQTAEDLQKTIAALEAQIKALSATPAAPATGSAYTFTRPLTLGSTGADVTALQTYLIGAGFAIPAGATGYFGAQTQSAVAAWQTANGVMPAAGYFGPVSQAKYMALMAAVTPVTPGDEDEDEAEDEDAADLQGEGTLDVFEMDDANDTDIQEGAEDEVIAEITMEATDGDIEVDRMTFVLEGDDSTTNTENDPWDVFETITLWVDGDMIAEFDASDEDAYLDEDNGEFRFSGLGLVLAEDEEVEVQVGATVVGSVDDAGVATKADWELTATDVRYFDADGVAEDDATTDELPTANATFEIVVEGDGEELKFAVSSANPKESDIIVDTDDITTGVTILEYTIEAEEGDIELNTLFVKLTTSTTSDKMLDEVTLDIDGEKFDTETTATTTGLVQTHEFDIDGDVVVKDGDSVTVKVMIDFRAQEVSAGVNRYSNGDTIMAEVTSVEVDATDAEGQTDITDAQLTGTASGETHTVIAAGLIDESIETSQDGGGTSGLGTFTFEVELKAIEDTAYLATTSAASALNAGPFRLSLVGTTATTSYLVQSDATIEGGYYRINEGATETFKITVSVDPVVSGSFYVVLDDVRFKLDTPGAANRTFDFTPQSEFDTNAVSVTGTAS
jgi:peptidoglycan hydrolase-like protein with peptidoglycan-binding domain